MEKHHRLSVWIARDFPVDRMTVTNVEHAFVIGLGDWVHISDRPRLDEGVGCLSSARVVVPSPARLGFRYGPVMKTYGINHVALYVEDLTRSRDFYMEVFEATLVRENESACFLEVGDDNFLALFRRDPAHINHFCFTVDAYDPDTAAAELEGRGLEIIRREDRVFARDPDGHLVQVSAPATAEDFSG